jgi:WD40 repeat protein
MEYRGATAWCPITRRLAIWNLNTGVDVYQLSERPKWFHHLPVNVAHGTPKQVNFGHEGEQLISGSSNGEVNIWNLRETSSNRSQVFVHAQGLSVCNSPDPTKI